MSDVCRCGHGSFDHGLDICLFCDCRSYGSVAAREAAPTRMTAPIPDEAITAAAEALISRITLHIPEITESLRDQITEDARAALAAAEKPWREHIAQEIRERIDTDQKRLTNYSLGWNAGMCSAARIVRGTPE